MNRTTTIRSVDSKSSPPLKRVLTEYLSLNEAIGREWQWKDFPWWYNERANLSVFAGAIWRSGGIAFEEFNSPKKSGKSKRSHTYEGRNGLYFKLGGKEFTVEAKNIFVWMNPRNGDARTPVQRMLNEAIRDVKKTRFYGSRRLAVLFVVPRCKWSERGQVEKLITMWLKEIRKIRCTAAAWIFPQGSRVRAHWKKTRLFPGIVVLIRKV